MNEGQKSKGETLAHDGEQGYILLGLIVAIFIMTLFLGVAASKAAFAIRLDRERETVRRGNQYVRAIREFYIKNGNHYPGSIEQLEKTNNIRFLRQRYLDPITGKDDWRLIIVGQNQTTVKGFFGEPLQGLPTSGLGSAAGIASGIGGTPTTTAVGANGATTGNNTPGTPGTGDAGAAGQNGANGSAGAFTAPGGIGGAGGFGGSSGSSFGSGSLGPMMGVGLGASGDSLVVLNEQTTYQTWEFLYDPRVELLKVKQQMNQGLGSAGAGSLGQPGSPGQSGFGSQPGGFGSPPQQQNGGTNQPAPGGFSTQP